jgi:hypothetical protein
MKHIILGHSWGFREVPFPGYYIPYGNGPMEPFTSFLLLVRNMRPVQTHQLIAPYDGTMLYYGGDATEAQRIASDFNGWQESASRYAQWSNPCDSLPEGRFRVLRCPYRGLLIDEGSDTTDRCLLFFCVGSGHKGGVEIDFKYTDAAILNTLYSSSSVRVALYGAALFEPGVSLVCRSWGFEHRERVMFRWNGSVIKTTRLSSMVWGRKSRMHRIQEPAQPAVL